MPRRPKSTAQHKIDGTYQPCRHEKRGDHVSPPGFPEMPQGLTAAAQQLWTNIVDSLPPAAIGSIDTASLTELVMVYQAMIDCRAQLADDPTAKDARISYCAYFDRWLRLAGDYGLTPAARAKLHVPPPEDASGPLGQLYELLASRD